MTKVRTTEVVVIGGGQAGLAMSQCLTSRSIDHVVLERGKTANSWRTERWDSLRLLTPNWMTRLPGWDYRGGDPDGYMTASEVTSHLDAYRRAIAAPIRCGVEVARITTTENVHHGHLIETNEGPWCSSAVVIATGACSNPRVPAIAAEMPDHVQHVTPIRYRNPSQLGDGGVLVVGASASGLQIADELSQAGRAVTLAVGDHVRLPRAYRGRDIHWWMDAIGQLDERYDEVDDIDRARRLPSLQLIGSSERRDLDLNAVAASGVRLTGRLVGRSGHRAQFSGSFANMCVSADLKQRRLLDRLDDYAALISLDAELTGPTRPEPTVVGGSNPRGRSSLDRHHRLGDRLPAALPLARSAPPRPEGPAPARRRRAAGARHVCPRTAIHAASKVELPRRRRPRRLGAHRAPVRPPGAALPTSADISLGMRP